MKKYELRYRVIPNSTCNDFNNELPYTLVTVDYDTKTNLIRQRGFNSWSKHNCDLFTDRKYAEKWLCELNYNTFFNKEQKDQRIIELEKELAELKEKYIIPKFQLGQTIFTANKPNECIYELKIVSIHIERSEFCDRKFNSLVYRAERIKDGCIGGYSEDELFATEQEALEKLKEMKGNE